MLTYKTSRSHWGLRRGYCRRPFHWCLGRGHCRRRFRWCLGRGHWRRRFRWCLGRGHWRRPLHWCLGRGHCRRPFSSVVCILTNNNTRTTEGEHQKNKMVTRPLTCRRQKSGLFIFCINTCRDNDDASCTSLYNDGDYNFDLPRGCC